MRMLRLSSIVSVKLKHSWQKPNSSLLFFKRRVPDDIKPLLAADSKYAGKTFYVVSLKTSDPRVAAVEIERLVSDTDRDWAQLRTPSREGTVREAQDLLLRAGIDPSDPKATPEAVDAFHDVLDGLLPRSVREDDTVTEGRHLDRYLPPAHAAAFQMLQGRFKLTLGECLEQYVAARPGTEKDARMVFGYLFAFLGSVAHRPPTWAQERDLGSLKRLDVNNFVAWLRSGKHSDVGRKISTTTVGRYLTTLRAAFARAIRENELAVANVFTVVEIPEAGKDVTKRETFTVEQYGHLHNALEQWRAKHGPDQLRCILTLVAETGARLAEIVGLATTDVHPRSTVPHLVIQEHPWRPLKTLGSARKVPLTPRALETVQIALKLAGTSPYLFSQYTDVRECKASTASAALVQWVRTREGLKGTKLGNHSLRHGIEDLLRAVGCPDSVRDQITGHKTPGMGANYGEGYPLAKLAVWLAKAAKLAHA